MNLILSNKPDRTRPLDMGCAADQLGFLLAQLPGSKVESIVARVERLADVATGETLDGGLSGLSGRTLVGQAIARILYAVAGMSYEDRVFALTYAEIQALLDGANDESFDTYYRH